tara:strand:+ start:1233 stop:2276 length:1044 start_codon:yes stop_codon:yes gene_type:complete
MFRRLFTRKKKPVNTRAANNNTKKNEAERQRMIKLLVNWQKRYDRASSEHLMRRLPAKMYRGAVGGQNTTNKAVNAARWTRYLDTNERRILISKNGNYFVIDYNNNNKPIRRYNPVVAYLNNPGTGNRINVRNNTPLPLNLNAVGGKGNKVYNPVKDLRKFSQAVVYNQKKKLFGNQTAPNRSNIFKKLKNYTNMARTNGYGYATKKEPYSLGNFNKGSKWYIPIKPGNKKKYKNIATTNRLPPLTMGNRRYARREAYRYSNNGAEEPFTAILNAWNKRNRPRIKKNRMNVIKEAGANSVLPRNIVNKIANEATTNSFNYFNYKPHRRERRGGLENWKGLKPNRWMK